MILSIIIPMFNSSKYLDDLLKSVEIGLNTEIELILVNDGSSDDTLKKCVVFANNKENVRIINNTNHGVSYSRNCGIVNATGKYVMFLDSDDLLLDDWYTIVWNGIVESDEADIIVFLKDSVNSKPDLKDIIKCIIGVEGKLDYSYLGSPFSRVFRKDYLINEKIQFNEQVIHGEDALFNIAAFINSKSYFFIRKSIYSYRINITSSTHKYDKRFLTSNSCYLHILQELLIDSGLFNEMQIHEYLKYSFVNSIYIFAGRVSKISSRLERKKAIKDFYLQSFYLTNLKNIKKEVNLPLYKRIIYMMIRHRMFWLVEFVIEVLRKKKKEREYSWEII